MQHLLGLEQELKRASDAGEISGASVLVGRRGQFDARFATGDFKEDSICWIASMSKPITTFAALILVQRRMLRLQDLVSDYIPCMREPRLLDGLPAVSPTVLDLMRHPSGFIYHFLDASPLSKIYEDAATWCWTSSNERMTNALSLLPLRHQPGTTFEYGMSTDVLGRLIEVCSGQSLDEFLSQNIFDPLGMGDTGFCVKTDSANRLAKPLEKEDFQLAPPSSGATWMSGGAGLWSTAFDYFRFGRMLLAGGELDGTRILSAELVKLMTCDRLPPNIAFGTSAHLLGDFSPVSSYGQGFGLGLCIRTSNTQGASPTPVGTFSWPGSSGTDFWCDPQNDLVSVVLTQAPSMRNRFRTLARSSVYDEIVR